MILEIEHKQTGYFWSYSATDAIGHVYIESLGGPFPTLASAMLDCRIENAIRQHRFELVCYTRDDNRSLDSATWTVEHDSKLPKMESLTA